MATAWIPVEDEWAHRVLALCEKIAKNDETFRWDAVEDSTGAKAVRIFLDDEAKLNAKAWWLKEWIRKRIGPTVSYTITEEAHNSR